MLLRNADAAMYHAKAEGRNAYRFYSVDMTERAHARLAMESALRRALNEQQFLLYYQPQYELATGRLVGAEALIRWQHPADGLVLPGSFVPIAEDTGQIVQIGAWVLESACAQMKDWQDAGMTDFKMAINLSGRQTLNSDLVESVKRIVQTTGCNPRHIELEITEGFLIQHPERSRATLQELCNLGIEIAVDDFGTGYSSLSYLKQFPISKLKIDGSFVHDIPFDINDQAISTAIIALGKSLGLAVVAEGVENREQVEFLTANGCDQVQGFFYSKPLSADSFWRCWQDHDAGRAR
jgi:EAL domain-containing protein (putative c-di-GMP-specific phosphodiesterase class I)